MSKIITEWNAKRFIAEVSGQLVTNMEAACQFVERVAESSVPVRTGVLRGNIDHEVQARGQEIVGIVGVTKKLSWRAMFIEFGTRKMGAQPFLRPAVFGNLSTIVRILTKGA